MLPNINTKQDVIDGLSPELPPEQAKQYLHVATTNCEERKKETDIARSATEKCQAVLNDDDDTLRFLRELQGKLTAELSDLKATSRTEFFALRAAFNLDEVSSLIQRKSGTAEYVDREYDFLLTVKRGADYILLLDAIANQRSAECSEMSAMAVLSRIKTIIALGPVIESEGDCGFIGAATEKLREEAQVLAKTTEVAQNTARDARLAYERQQSARISRGIITSACLPNAVQH